MRGKVLALLAVGLSLLFGFSAAEGVNRALVIGCDRFLTRQDTAPAAANNVRLMAAALRGGSMDLASLSTQRSGIPDAVVLRLMVESAFEGATEEDTSYLYLATHGELDSGGEAVLVLSDGSRETVVTARELKALLDTVPGKKVLILDACQSGAMLGKGLAEPAENLFAGEDYVVICSSGGAEASWLWTDAEGAAQGQSYFSAILAAGLSAAGGFAADDNGDGTITLTELHRFLLSHCGESTVQTYPEESDFPVLRYGAEAYSEERRTVPLDNIAFEEGVLAPEQPECGLSFTVVRACRLGYRVIYMKNGVWDFAGAETSWDAAEENGTLQPGWYERTLSLQGGEAGGYALLQLVTVTDGETRVAASHILCVPPLSGDPELSVAAPESFSGELTFTVRHSLPCALTVTVEAPDGTLLRRLCTRQASRPQQIGGTSLTWSGLDAGGERVQASSCVIRVRTEIGGVVYETVSEEIQMAE